MAFETKLTLAKAHLKKSNEMIKLLREKAKTLNGQAEFISKENHALRKAIKQWEQQE